MQDVDLISLRHIVWVEQVKQNGDGTNNGTGPADE